MNVNELKKGIKVKIQQRAVHFRGDVEYKIVEKEIEYFDFEKKEIKFKNQKTIFNPCPLDGEIEFIYGCGSVPGSRRVEYKFIG